MRYDRLSGNIRRRQFSIFASFVGLLSLTEPTKPLVVSVYGAAVQRWTVVGSRFSRSTAVPPPRFQRAAPRRPQRRTVAARRVAVL
jgi:hypothetical protein